MFSLLTIIQGHHIWQGTVIRHAQICVQRGNILKSVHQTHPVNPWKQCTVWPEEGSSVTHHCFGWLRWWCTVSCTRSWSCAGRRPPAVLSLSSPPSCTAATGSSSVVYWGDPPGRVCGPPHKSAAEEPSPFPALATLNPTIKTMSNI